MATQESCPSSARLKALLDGALPEAEQAELSRHVDICGPCQTNLEGLVAGKDSWSGLARRLGHKASGEEAGYSATEDRAQCEDAGRTLAEPADGDPSLAFLDPPDKPQQLGRLGHYEIQEVIGKGGFGIVLKAFDAKLHRVVAIKVLAPELAASATARNRFIREARAAAAITHEHVVTIHVVDEEHRPPYLVMQLIDGMTLQQKLDKVGALSLMEILRIGMQMADGLAAAHKQGLVHRDIKPANVLLENGIERVKITDFGLAKIADDASVTQSGVVSGTPMYMSPEQANGLTIDHRSDLFSLGTVLYSMCTGRPPFRASGTMAVLKRVIDDTPRPVREINSEIPGWLEAIITKLHAKKPEDRYQTAREVADVLSHRLADLQGHGRVLSAADPGAPTAATAATTSKAQAPPTIQNWSWLWLAIGVATLSLAAFMVYSFFVTGIDVRDLVRAHEPYWAGAGVLVVLALCLLLLPSLVPGTPGGIPARAVRFLAVVPACVAIPLGYAGWKNYGNYATIHLSTDNSIYVGGLIQGPNYKTSIHFSNREGNLSPYIVPPGDYGVAGTHGGSVFFSEKFKLERGGVKSVHIPLLKPKGGDTTIQHDGWVQLFNGKDLAGWQTDQPEQWKVENGAIVGHGGRGFLTPVSRKFENFHCRLQAKINAEGWGSLAFRVSADRQGNVAICPKRGLTGSLYVISKEKTERLHQPEKQLASPDTWLNLEVIVQGKIVTVLVNGTKTAEGSIDDLPDRGSIYLNADAPGTIIHFRNIELKELPASQPATPSLAVAPFNIDKAKEHQEAWAKHLGVEPEITNSIGMKLRLIPPGEYLMGTSPEEIAWLLKEAPDLKDAPEHIKDNVRSEGPQRRVTIKEPFYIGAHEVTVGNFRAFVRATKHRTEAEANQGGVSWNDNLKKWERKPENVWDNAELSGEDTHPVVFVTLADAQAFCAWLTRQEGRAYAVPAEEQWEWACRAGATTRWFFGDNPDLMKIYGWTTPFKAMRRPVGGLAPNPFGLHDIYGNVQELTIGLHETIARGGQAGESSQRARSTSRAGVGKQYDPAIVRGFRVVIVGDLKTKTPPAKP